MHQESDGFSDLHMISSSIVDLPSQRESSCLPLRGTLSDIIQIRCRFGLGKRRNLTLTEKTHRQTSSRCYQKLSSCGHGHLSAGVVTFQVENLRSGLVGLLRSADTDRFTAGVVKSLETRGDGDLLGG